MKTIYSSIILLAIFSFTLISCGNSKPTLNIYGWGGFIKPEVIERFEKEHQCIVCFNFYESNEAMYAKLKAGATGYDLIVPSSYFVQILQDQELIEEIDKTLIPNLINLNQDILTKLAAPTLTHAVPYAVGYTGIGYDKAKLPMIDQSWGVYFQKDLKGRMTLLNDRREVLGAALKYLGYSANTKSALEINQATDLAIQWKKNIAKFEGEQYKNGLNSGEYLLVQGYSLDILQVMQENKNIEFFYPKEGVQIFLDTLAIPKNAPSRELSYAFINYLFEPEIAAENINFIRNLVLNVSAYPLLSDELKNNPAIFIPDETLTNSELIQDLDGTIKLYNAAWEKILEAS